MTQLVPAFKAKSGKKLDYKGLGYGKFKAMLEDVPGVSVVAPKTQGKTGVSAKVILRPPLQAAPVDAVIAQDTAAHKAAAAPLMSAETRAKIVDCVASAGDAGITYHGIIKAVPELGCTQTYQIDMIIKSLRDIDELRFGDVQGLRKYFVVGPHDRCQARGTISTQTADGFAAVDLLQQLSTTFRGRTWPSTKAELRAGVGDRNSAQLKPLVTIWKASGCLTGKGGKKNKYVWIQEVIQRTLVAARAAQAQTTSTCGLKAATSSSFWKAATPAISGGSPSATAAIQYIDSASKLEAAVQAIQDTVRFLETSGGQPQTAGAGAGCEAAEPRCLFPEADSADHAQAVVAIGTKSGAGDLSLVQLATAETVYLFDCFSLTKKAISTALAPLCADPKVVKVAFDIHQTAFVLGIAAIVGTADIQLAIELLTSDPARSFSECISQLQPASSAVRMPPQMQQQQQQRASTADAGYDVRPLPATAKQRAAKDTRDLLGVWPRLLEALEPNMMAAVMEASDLRAALGATSLAGSRRIVFDTANSYAIASRELMATMRPGDAHVPGPLVVSNDTGVLLDLLPRDIADELRHRKGDAGGTEERDLTLLLSDIVLDKGRPACAWIAGDRVRLGASERVIGMGDIDAVLDKLGGFGSDNRAGLEQQLHRISGMRNRNGDVIGLTMRVGRHVSGNADMISDLLFGDDRSILFLGEPGSGKTTIVREATRLLAMESNVCIVDTSNEIAGDGDVPHPCIGLARRMMVPSLDAQAGVMVECVQNHTPEVMVIDEIGRSSEVEAARTCKQRGVRMIASAHGDLRKLVKNKQIRSLVGGVESTTLGDAAAAKEGRKHGGGGFQKIKAQRAGPATFDIIVELRRGEKHEWRVILDAGRAVDAILEGQQFSAQRRTRDAESGVVELTLESA